VVGFDCVEVVDVGSHKFKDEHDIVSLIQVDLFVFLDCLCDFFLFFVLLAQLIHVNMLGLHDCLLKTFFLFDLFLLSIDVVIVDFDILFVKFFVLFYIQS